MKPTDLSLGQQIDMRVLPGGTVTATAVTLKFLITVAYGVQNVQVSGGRDGWTRRSSTFWRSRPTVLSRKYCRCFQSLLEDRFKLVIRREMRELSVYELKLPKPEVRWGQV